MPGLTQEPDWHSSAPLQKAPSDPQAVADAIALAATDPEAPFRIVVGDDANQILAAKTAMSFEDFEQAMRSTTNWYE